MARHMNPSSSTNKTIDAIDRKRERERRFMLRKARDNAAELSTALVQRLLDQHIIETNSDQAIREAMEKQLTLTQDPNIISLFITQYIVEDLINHPNIQDVFGDDLDVYRAVDSIMSKIRPR